MPVPSLVSLGQTAGSDRRVTRFKSGLRRGISEYEGMFARFGLNSAVLFPRRSSLVDAAFLPEAGRLT